MVLKKNSVTGLARIMRIYSWTCKKNGPGLSRGEWAFRGLIYPAGETGIISVQGGSNGDYFSIRNLKKKLV